MERREDYEPLILDLQKSQAVRQHKRYAPLFVSSIAILGILLVVSALYFTPPWFSTSFKPPAGNAGVVPTPTATPESREAAPVLTPEQAPTVQATPASDVEEGWLTLFSSPEHADIVIGGETLGKTPLYRYPLEAGTYTITFVYEGRKSTQKVTISAGEVTELTYRFPGFASLKIRTTRSGSEITLNGTFAGISPLLVDGLSAGTYTIEASKKGYAAAEKTVTVAKGEHREVLLTMKPLDSSYDDSSSSSDEGPVHPSDRLRENQNP